MRINFVVWTTKLTGGNRVIFELANRLWERGHEVVITTFGPKPTWFNLKPRLILLRNPFKYPSLLNFLYGFFSLSKNLINCDATIATWWPTAFPVAFFGKGRKIYFVQHYEPWFFSDENPIIRLLMLPLRKLVDLTYDLFDEKNIVVISKWLKLKFMKEKKKKVVHIPPGINKRIFFPRKKVKKKEKIVLHIGRKVKWKGTSDLIKAMEIVSKEIKNIKLIIVSNEIENISHEIYCEILRADDNKLAILYSNADVFVHPSWYEGYTLPPLEAMACGCPVVTTNTQGIATEYAKHKYNCLLVPPKNPKKLAEAILLLLKDKNLRKKIIRNGFKTAEKLEWNKIVDKFERFLMKSL